MPPDQYLGWLAHALTPGLAARMAGKLLGAMGSPEVIFNASLTELESHRLPAAVAQMIHTCQPMSAAAKELAQAQAAGTRLLTWDQPEFPERLREIYDPPPLLYVRGNIELLILHLISIVGSRRPTPFGNQMAEKLARDLAHRGLVIVSGLARGIDSCAHKGALSSLTGATIGVLVCGIDVTYPKENKKIFAEMETRLDHLRICDADVPWPAKLPDSKPHHFGNVCRCGCRGRRAILRLPDYRTPGHGIRPRGLWSAGERHPAHQLWSQPAHQTGCQAGYQLGRRDRRAADAHSRRASAGGNGLQRGASAAGGRGFGSGRGDSVPFARSG